MKKKIFVMLVLLLIALTCTAQRVTLMYQDGLTHTTVKHSVTSTEEHYILGARNGKLWTNKLTDIILYETDYITMINTLQLILNYVETKPPKGDFIIVDDLKVEYKKVAFTKCIVITSSSNVVVNTTPTVIEEALNNIIIWEENKYLKK